MMLNINIMKNINHIYNKYYHCLHKNKQMREKLQELEDKEII